MKMINLSAITRLGSLQEKFDGFVIVHGQISSFQITLNDHRFGIIQYTFERIRIIRKSSDFID